MIENTLVVCFFHCLFLKKKNKATKHQKIVLEPSSVYSGEIFHSHLSTIAELLIIIGIEFTLL